MTCHGENEHIANNLSEESRLNSDTIPIQNYTSTAPQKFLTHGAADAGPDRGASEEPIRRRSVTSEQRRAGPAGAAPWVWNFCGAVLSSSNR